VAKKKEKVSVVKAKNLKLRKRFSELARIKERLIEGKTTGEIAQELGISVASVKEGRQYLRNLVKADLTSVEIGEKRGELYLELDEISHYAKEMYLLLRNSSKLEYRTIRAFLALWKDIVESKMKLYGLDNLKVANLVQINQNYGPPVADTIDIEAGEVIAKMLKETHERKLQARSDISERISE